MDTDKRWKALGESLINYSLAMQPGEKLMIAMYETESYPLALAAYEACIKAGGYPQIQFMSPGYQKLKNMEWNGQTVISH